MRSETFGRLLKVGIGSIATGEGKAQPAIEDELGQQIGVTGASIQRYKAGHLPPELRTIEILAEAAVKRGLLGREWLERFLHAAQYPAPERLLDKLCPTGPVRQRPPRIYENLPAPTYSQFVMRPQVFAEVAEGLAKRSATVLIVGFGGNGKTSLAREIAARCLTGDDVVPQFDAVVWVSDKDRPGTTNLSMVLDEIARTLDYPGFTQFEHQEKRREVEQLLRRQRVLVVIDNFETITDGALLSWLLNLPEPSKALITTREYRREFRRGGWPVDLRGMTEDEARELIAERVKVLKIEKLVGDLTQLEPLLAATGGNPKAIEMMMGLLKYERRPLQEVVDDLYAARGALFDDLFARAWALLDEGARRVLLVATFFPANACAAALSATADVQGYALERAAERLSDLALIDVQQEDLTTIPRYALHPLVRAFARAELEKQLGFEVGARERWVRWYSQRVSEVGYCWNDISKLDLLELEHETVFAVTQWCFERSWLSTVIQLVKNAGYFFHVRGYWEKIESMLFMGADAAFRSQDYPSETLLLAYRVQLYCREGKIDEASSLIPRVRELMEFEDVPEEYRYEACVALSFYWNRTKNPDKTFDMWMNRADFFEPRSRAGRQSWLASCFYEKGDLAKARTMLQEYLRLAIQYNIQRAIIGTQIYIIRIDLDQGNLIGAADALDRISSAAREYQDRHYTARIQRTYGRLYALREDFIAAQMAFHIAIDLFERLGAGYELAEAREELARLEAGAAPTPAPPI